MLLAIVAACEVGFWVVLLCGLVARYVLRRPRLGGLLLACVPLVDLVLLIATTLHLRAGATADATHGLAAAYIGFSLAFGHDLIGWADARFARRFAGGPPPRPVTEGPTRAQRAWREFGKATLAWGISCVLLVGGIALVGDDARTAALGAWIGWLTLGLGVWLLWTLGCTLGRSKSRPTKAI